VAYHDAGVGGESEAADLMEMVPNIPESGLAAAPRAFLGALSDPVSCPARALDTQPPVRLRNKVSRHASRRVWWGVVRSCWVLIGVAGCC